MDWNSYFEYYAFFNKNQEIHDFFSTEILKNAPDIRINLYFSFTRIDDEIFVLRKYPFFEYLDIPSIETTDSLSGVSLDLLDTSEKFFYRISKRINRTIYPKTNNILSGNLVTMIN